MKTIDTDLTILEGARHVWRFTFKTESGEVRDPAAFQVYGAADCLGQTARQMLVSIEGNECVVQMPGLTLAENPWNFQILAKEITSRVEWLLAVGSVNLIARAAGAGVALDPGTQNYQATINSETHEITIVIGDNTASVAENTKLAKQHAEDAKAAQGKAEDAQKGAETAQGKAEEAQGKAEDAQEGAETAQGKAEEAQGKAEDAQEGAETAQGKAEEAQAAAEKARDEAQEISGEYVGHLTDNDRHLTAAERKLLATAIPDWEAANSVPEGALTHAAIRAHFAMFAQQDATVAPSAVYVTRVPYARYDEEAAAWKNTASAVDESVYGVSRKMLDNEGLVHTPSTDKVEGQDDYIGKQWPFYVKHGNYMTDEYGVKHVTAIEGVSIDGATFDPNKPVCAMGPAFYFFCVKEHSQDEETGTWRTHDGTEDGVALFQDWGISARPWAELDAERRAKLAKLGVHESDFHLYPSATQWDPVKEKPVMRPYYCDAAYCGGAELQDDGSYMVASKPNLPIMNQMSHNVLNSKYSYRAGFGGSASVQGRGLLFGIVKNGTKNSQTTHAGNTSNYPNAVRATLSTAEPDYVFPVSAQSHFRLGCTVYLGQANVNPSGVTYKRSVSAQVGRIEAIETRTLTLADGTTAESLCLVFDPATVEPFIVRAGDDDAAAIAATKELTDAGTYAACFATQGFSLSGETDAVIGSHDGSRESNTDAKHSYRVQLTEYLPGVWIVAADTVAIKGTGSIEVAVDGVTSTPSTTQYVILQAGYGVTRRSGGTLQQYLDSGYTPVGIAPAVKEGYILNMQLSATCVAYPTANGGTGSGASTGHGDYYYIGASPAEFLMGGYLNLGTYAGAGALTLRYALGTAFWFIGARD